MKALLPKEFADHLEPHLTSDRYPDLEKAWVDSTGNLDGDPTDAEVYFNWFYLNPHSARNGRKKRIRKQEQGTNSSVGRREKRNSKCEGEAETNLQLESGSEKKLNEPP